MHLFICRNNITCYLNTKYYKMQIKNLKIEFEMIAIYFGHTKYRKVPVPLYINFSLKYQHYICVMYILFNKIFLT